MQVWVVEYVHPLQEGVGGLGVLEVSGPHGS